MKDEDIAWVEYREKFADVYDQSNYSSPIQARVMRASHRLLEKNHKSSTRFDRVLEVGAGTGEHIHFVKHKFDEYTMTDMDPKTLEIAKSKLPKDDQSKFKFKVQSGSSLDFADNSFDRLIATHVLEHIYQPHLAIKEWRRVIKNHGVISILIPTDPGMAWRLGRHMGPRRTATKLGIAYDYVMAREHVNSCNNLIALLRHYFPERTEHWWPLRVPSIDLNLFFSFNAVVNKKAEE